MMKEKEESSINNQKKIEILQNKVLENTDDKLDSSTALIKVIEMLQDSLSDMKMLFKSKVVKLTDLISDRKEEMSLDHISVTNLIKERSDAVMEVLSKLKHSLEEDIRKAKMKLHKDSTTKNSEMVEWLKRQINELQPYKNKVMFLDNKTAQHEANIRLIQIKLQLADVNVVNLEKIIQLKESQIEELRLYSENLEAKLSDVKDFVFKNCNDQLDHFSSSFKNYYSK